LVSLTRIASMPQSFASMPQNASTSKALPRQMPPSGKGHVREATLKDATLLKI
jgi:hypothetical protein